MFLLRPAWLAAIAAAVYFAAAAIAIATDAATSSEDEYRGLPPGSGRDEVLGICGTCHSMKLVTQQGLSRSTWAELLVLMVEEHEMAELEPEDEVLILDYLAKFYGPDRLARKDEALASRYRVPGANDARDGAP